jgi:hypothetical protein
MYATGTRANHGVTRSRNCGASLTATIVTATAAQYRTHHVCYQHTY